MTSTQRRSHDHILEFIEGMWCSVRWLPMLTASVSSMFSNSLGERKKKREEKKAPSSNRDVRRQYKQTISNIQATHQVFESQARGLEGSQPGLGREELQGTAQLTFSPTGPSRSFGSLPGIHQYPVLCLKLFEAKQNKSGERETCLLELVSTATRAKYGG